MSRSQLKMIIRDLSNLPPIEIPKGYELRTFKPGDEAAWAEIMNTGIGEWNEQSCREKLTGCPQFMPEGLFFVTYNGKPVGSACAWRPSETEWEKGSLHMVCVLPEHRSKGLGYLLSLAVLHFFRDHGFKEVELLTDDFRIPAIKTYLRLGFQPLYTDDTHPTRWKTILAQIGETK
ncbi:MAG: GNAT family N-acetyltransferase [Armatimonadota bacterium]|nr:GNAT family N-acetyltransferase [Armatimonadota bacterium]